MIAPGNHCYLKIRCALQHPRGKVRAFGAKESDKLKFETIYAKIPDRVVGDVVGS